LKGSTAGQTASSGRSEGDRERPQGHDDFQRRRRWRRWRWQFRGQDSTKFEVRIAVKEGEDFRPGMSVTTEIETRYRTNALTVPIGSVTARLPKPETRSGPTRFRPTLFPRPTPPEQARDDGEVG